MIRNKRFYGPTLLLAMLMILGFTTVCLASSGGSTPIPDPGGAPPRLLNFYVIGWSAINFFILLALLYKFAYNPISKMLEQRATTIESSLKHAEQVRIEIDEMMKETQSNLAESRKEAQEIVARATKAAEESKNEIIAKAQEEALNMKAKATAEIQAATEQAKMELRDTAAALAIMAAEKVLERAINEEDHRKMVKQFVNEAGDLLC
ncbi:MAG: F0F1 ATP synthase subunit B [Syntrophomonadaceae bacterium]